MVSPALANNGTIYYGDHNGDLYAVDPDGFLKWKYSTGGQIDSSPAIASDGSIYVGNGDGDLYAVNPSGSLKWKCSIIGTVISTPAIGSDGTIYIGCLDKYLYAINPNGSLKWKYLTEGKIYTSPAIASDGTIYVGSYDKYLYALNPDGSLKWKVEYCLGLLYYSYFLPSSPVIAIDGTVYIGSDDNNLYAINPNGTVKWKYETDDTVYSTPAIGSDGTIYVGSDDENLHAINPNGSLKWKYLTGSSVRSSPSMRTDGTIYVGSDDSYLYAINSGVTGGLATGDWPKVHRDNHNSGRVYNTTGTISGTIKQTSSNTVIAGATVTITPGNYTVTTNSSGVYTIANIPTGTTYTVTVTASNYASRSQTSGTVTQGNTTTVNISLTPAGSISGTITNSGTGGGASGATVKVTPGNYTATTNSRGWYSVEKIPVGTSYTVTVTATNYTSKSQSGVTVTHGNATTVNLMISPTGTIAGTVTNSITGVGVSGARITATPGSYSATTNSSGGYTIANILSGSLFTVTATAANYTSKSQYNVMVNQGSTTTVNFSLMNPSIFPFVSDTACLPGEDFVATINVSSVSDLFGTGFNLNYTQPSFITVKSVESGIFLGSDLAFFSDWSVSGKVGIGVSAKKGVIGKDGDGILARVTFQCAKDTPDNTPVIFTISNLSAFNTSGQTLTFNSARTDTVKIRSLDVTVWPGDMDNDGDVDQADILKLGIYYEKSGPSRTGGSMNWTGQAAKTWVPREAVYADANGDGKVTPADLVAIGLNWGNTHTVSKIAASPSEIAESTSGTLSLRSDTAFPLREGDEFRVDVTITDASSLFGLSFILYDQRGVIVPLSAEQGTFFGGNDLFFPQVNPEQGTVAVGMSRKSGESALDGSGTVLRIKFKALRDVEKDNLINFLFKDIVANDASGNALALAAIGGSIGGQTGVTETPPLGFRLAPNYPNPFNPNTTITFTIPEAGMVSLAVYDINGRLVRTLVSRILSAGTFSETWNGRDDYGRPVSSGVYVSRLTQGSHSAVNKMVLMK